MSVLSIVPPVGIWKMEETTEEMWSLLQHKAWYLPEFSRLKAEQRQKEWLATRLLLKEMLGHEAIIHHHPSGAPYLPDAEQKQISISHTKDFVAIMLTDATQMAGIESNTGLNVSGKSEAGFSMPKKNYSLIRLMKRNICLSAGVRKRPYIK